MNKINIETGVGIFLIAGLLCFGYLSVKLGDVEVFGTEKYPVTARFANISGLKEGATVEIAGVTVGRVSTINLNNYEAEVQMLIDPDIRLQDDVIAYIRTQGIIGDKYVKIKIGGSDEYIERDGEILETESAIELEELVSKYVFEKE
jgi:phospholipid/cholesterol/gamma-HCH transport system substrate-binding protein